MFGHSTNTASFVSVLSAALIFSLSLAGVAAAQEGNTSLGTDALQNNTTGSFNTASGRQAVVNNTTGIANTGIGLNALFSNITGNFNTAIGNGANVSGGNLTNATAIGNGATVNASNKVRLGDVFVEVVQYEQPEARPKPADHMITDQGIMNIAFGSRDIAHVQRLASRIEAQGIDCSEPTSVDIAFAIYVMESEREIELIGLDEAADPIFGFVPGKPFFSS